MLGDRWGVSGGETVRRYPCDDFVVDPVLRAWRGVRVAAPPERVWAWVRQIRLGPYSYDWIDNLGRRSPRRLVEVAEPRVGEPVTSTGGRPQGRVLAVVPGRELTARIMGAVMSYVLVPQPDGSTRLLLKVVMGGNRLVAWAVCLGDLVMARRQLLTFKRLAEGSAG
ncbi:polyketide cyclase [Actinoplanes oblitus]|uniref:Polyketide cyclase n=1 Tax=Actinoplanes oblitus TaxID=3040509 RepID=A0ABY8W8G9_9ACTN|nr:polyketide cyclase [Actinoplanes oblitus]WIM92684.1 polyketide cyclase [Actinoplanes oblitus]